MRCAFLIVGLMAGIPAVARAEDKLTAKTVDDAIERGADWILKQRNSQGHWDSGGPKDQYWGGNTALSLLALLYAGRSPRDEVLAKPLDWLNGQTLNATYVYGTRAHVLSLALSQSRRKRLNDDLEWLLRAVWPKTSPRAGAYGYYSAATPQAGDWADNSNSQFGVLGVWMATEAGANHSNLPTYWSLVENHWIRHQNPDGGWSYRDQMASTGSMTAAGLASLYVVIDRLHGDNPSSKAGLAAMHCIERATDWMAQNYSTDNPGGDSRWKSYYLYGVERVGRASGLRYFRDRDWFREGAADLVSSQAPDGSWSGGLHETCFALMFLSHGRAPLVLSKLQHGDDWNRQPRDAPGLTRFAERSLERFLNWQVVNLAGPVDDLLEAPLLYMTGASAWEFTDEEAQRLAEYLRRGGMILAIPQNQSPEFLDSMKTLAGKIAPGRPPESLPKDHPLFSGQVQFAVADPPDIIAYSNGIRVLMMVSQEDVSSGWGKPRGKAELLQTQLGCNFYLFATDKTALYNRLTSAGLSLEVADITRTIRLARIKYAGNWDVEPYGWQQLRYYMNNEANTRLTVKHGVGFDSRELEDFKIAYISGTAAFELNAEERAGLRRFLTDGGTLLSDAAGGSKEFLESFQRQMQAALKTDSVTVPPRSPIVTGKGIDGATELATVHFRRGARDLAGKGGPPLRGFEIGKRYAVVYLPIDASAGLLGTEIYGCRGLEGPSSLKTLRNLILYADLPTASKASLHAK